MKLDFCKINPRLGRIRHLGLTSFWISLMLIMGFFLTIRNFPVFVLLFMILFFVIGLVNVIFLHIRRLHDFNYRGWWFILAFVPIIGWLWGSLIFFIPGTNGSNRFGEKPDEATGWDFLLILAVPILYSILHWIKIFNPSIRISI